MKRLISLLLTLAMLVSLCTFASFAEGEGSQPEELLGDDIDLSVNIDDNFEDNVVLVTFKEEYSDPDVEVTASDFPGINVDHITNYVISDPDLNFKRDVAVFLSIHSKSYVIDVCDTLNAREDVDYAIPSYIMEVELNTVPNDPKYAQYVNPYTQVNAQGAWDYSTGSSSVKVAIIDNKFAYNNDMTGNFLPGYDLVNNNNIIDDGDYMNHGARVSSIVGAKGNNNNEMCGICWDVSLYPLQAGVSNGYISINAFYNAFSKMRENDVFIANASFGGVSNWGQSLIKSIKDKLEEWGGVLVCSAGNNHLNNNDVNAHYPSSIDSDYIISVAACNTTATGFANYSNYGLTTVDIVAPGTSIYTLDSNSGDANHSGTSFSAPFVTGSVALLKSAFPDATSEELIRAIEEGASPRDWTEGMIAYGFLDIENSMEVLETIIENRRTIEDGTYTIGARNDAFVVFGFGDAADPASAPAIMQSYNGEDSQRFEIEYNIGAAGEDYYTIKNVVSEKYLTASGTTVQQSDWTGSDSQKWRIKLTSDDTYFIENMASHRRLDFGVNNPSENQAVTLQSAANSSKQKFRFNNVEGIVTIPDGVYRISAKEDPSLFIYDDHGFVKLGTQQLYLRVTNENGYCYIRTLFGNDGMMLYNNTGIVYEFLWFEEAEESSSHKWIMKDAGDGYVYITSPYAGKVLDVRDEIVEDEARLVRNDFTGSESQKFSFVEANRNDEFSINNDILVTEGYCYAMDETSTYLLDINEGPMMTMPSVVPVDQLLYFDRGLYGLYTIRNVATGQVLTADYGGVVYFDDANGSTSQLWKIGKLNHTKHVITNLFTEEELRYYTRPSDGYTYITTNRFFSPGGCKYIEFARYENVQENVQYLIVPKSDPTKAISIINPDELTNHIPVGVDDFDFSNPDQQFEFTFGPEYFGSYGISNQQYANLNICFAASAELQTGCTPFVVKKESDGYFKLFCLLKHALTYENGSLILTHNKAENDDDQKFMIIPVSDTVNIGLYMLKSNDDPTKALTSSGQTTSGSPVEIATANSSDNSQKFVVYEIDGVYRAVNLRSNMALTLADNGVDIILKPLDLNDDSQKWQLINSTASGSNYTAQFVSYRTGDYLTFGSSAPLAQVFDHGTDQMIVMTKYTS